MIAHFISQSVRDYVSTHAPLVSGRGQLREDQVHLDAAIGWLMRSIDACDGKASSKGYRFLRGWMPPYPETSGYIIPTLLRLWQITGDESYKDRALSIGRWLVSIQLEDGGFVGRELGVLEKPVVFNTGMILLGLASLIRNTGDKSFVGPARRAADFLESCMDDDGCFVRNLSNDIVHTYNVRTAWALASFGRAMRESRYRSAALANARWALGQQLDNGFFLNNTFKPGGNANTHGLAYVLRGLFEINQLTGDRLLLDAVKRSADSVVTLYGIHGRIAGDIGPKWEYLSSHVCLTGYAQLAIVLFKLFSRTGEERYLNTALSLLDDVAREQNLGRPSAPYYGAIKGSMPIYGRYAMLQYPNWATKFFIDALIEKRKTWVRYADRVSV
ncbi:MAG: hypothetical protein VX871_05340 [Pseudomonadota bacterium]|nr:hypothetical protein [Pseudomonadota bacterium]